MILSLYNVNLGFGIAKFWFVMDLRDVPCATSDLRVNKLDKCIASWLSERFQKVVLVGQASDPVPVPSGVPQDRSWDRSFS